MCILAKVRGAVQEWVLFVGFWYLGVGSGITWVVSLVDGYLALRSGFIYDTATQR